MKFAAGFVVGLLTGVAPMACLMLAIASAGRRRRHNAFPPQRRRVVLRVVH